MQRECPRADDKVKTRELTKVHVFPDRVKKPVKTRKFLSFPLLVAGLRAKDEMAISQFEDFLLIEWSPIRESVRFPDFSEMLRRGRRCKQPSIAASFLKKIFIGCTHWPKTSDLVLIGPDLKEQFETLLHSKQFTSLGLVFAGVWSDQVDLQLLAIQRLRQLFIDLQRPPSITLIIEFGVVPRFGEFLGKENCLILQREAALALIDITSEKGDSIEFLINHELVGVLIKLLDFPDFHVRYQAVLELGMIAGTLEGRDLVHRHEAVRSLLEKVLYPLLQEDLLPLLRDIKKLVSYKEIDKHLPMLRIAAYTLLRFCKGASRPVLGKRKVTQPKDGTEIVLTPAELMIKGPHLDQVSAALPVLVHLVYLSDEVVLINACSVLACLTDNTYWKTQVVIDNDTCLRLFQLLKHQSPLVVTPALCTLGNIVARDDIQSQCIVDFGALPCLWKLLSQSIEKVEVWRTIANITKRNHVQIEEEQKLEVKEKLDKFVMRKLLALCVELDIPYPIATPRKEDIVAMLMNFLDPPHATTSDDEKEESRERKKRRRESAEQMSHQGESQELPSENKSTPSDDELRRAIVEILKEVDITKIKFTGILERLCKRFRTDLTSRKHHIQIMIKAQLHQNIFEDENCDEDDEILVSEGKRHVQ